MKWISKFKIFLLLIALVGVCLNGAYGEQLETKSSPNYLVILVHGINTTHRVFMGNGENGSDMSNIPADERYPWGDLSIC